MALASGKNKEPSLFRKLIDIYFEQAKRRKALRVLSKTSWSFDLLCLLLIKSAKALGDGVCMEIVNRDGQSIRLTYDAASKADLSQIDDSILNHLDDEAAVADFISRNGR